MTSKLTRSTLFTLKCKGLEIAASTFLLYTLFLINGSKYSYLNHTVTGELANAFFVAIAFQISFLYVVVSSAVLFVSAWVSLSNRIVRGLLFAGVCAVFAFPQLLTLRDTDVGLILIAAALCVADFVCAFWLAPSAE